MIIVSGALVFVAFLLNKEAYAFLIRDLGSASPAGLWPWLTLLVSIWAILRSGSSSETGPDSGIFACLEIKKLKNLYTLDMPYMATVGDVVYILYMGNNPRN